MKDDAKDRELSGGGRLTRLLDTPAGPIDDDAAWALELLREAPPHELKAGERQRVRLGLGRPRVATRYPWAIRLATAAAALVAATTIASAGLGHLPRWFAALSHPRPPNPQAQVHAGFGVVHHSRSRAATSGPAPQLAEPQTDQGIVSAAPSATDVSRRPRRHPGAPDQKEADLGLVVRAMRALRKDGDAALARALAGSYLERHPRGALAEEALALTIEAAVARHDRDAAALGARYLRQYPDGPFRGLARRVTDASAPGADR